MDYRQAAQKVETAYAPNQTIESIFHGLQPHFALRDGEESEIEYLRQLSDEILRVLLPEGEYQSDCVRWLVREIFCCLILRGLVEILTEPDMVNYIVNVVSSFQFQGCDTFFLLGENPLGTQTYRPCHLLLNSFWWTLSQRMKSTKSF